MYDWLEDFGWNLKPLAPWKTWKTKKRAATYELQYPRKTNMTMKTQPSTIPIYNLTNQVFFHCSIEIIKYKHTPSFFKVTWIESLIPIIGGHRKTPFQVTKMGPFTRSRLEEPGTTVFFSKVTWYIPVSPAAIHSRKRWIVPLKSLWKRF